jgi:hypothetical protein
MTEYNANPYQKQDGGVPGERRRQNEPAFHANKNPRDDEPTWPGAEYDDDEAVTTGMGDDDDDDDDAPTSPWRPATIDFQQPSLWDEAIARIFARKSRSDSP